MKSIKNQQGTVDYEVREDCKGGWSVLEPAHRVLMIDLFRFELLIDFTIICSIIK